MGNRVYITDDEARQTICGIGKKMYQRGFVCANDGNISVRVGDDQVWITPTGVSKGDLTPDILIKINMKGEILENPGNMAMTSESKMHLACYLENDNIMSTCHSHAPYATVCAVAGINLDVAFACEPVGVLGVVPVAPYRCPGTQELADSIKPFCKDYKTCLLSNHGAMTWGTTPIEAWYRMESLEAYAKLSIIMECVMGKSRPLSDAQIVECIELCKPPGINDKNRQRGLEEAKNLDQAIGLSQLSRSVNNENLGITLRQDQLELLADMVAQRLKQQ